MDWPMRSVGAAAKNSAEPWLSLAEIVGAKLGEPVGQPNGCAAFNRRAHRSPRNVSHSTPRPFRVFPFQSPS